VRAASLTLLDPELSPPRTSRALLGFAHRFADGTTVRLEGTHRRTELLLRRTDLNVPVEPALEGEGGRPVLSPLESFAGVVGPTAATWRRYGQYDAVWSLDGDGWSRYRGVTLGLDRRLGEEGLLFLTYTFSETTDNIVGVAAGGRAAALSPGIGEIVATPWEEGRSDLDAPHRGAAGVSIPIPGNILGSLGAVYRGRSGAPFTPMVARGLDVNGDGSWANDVAWISEGDSEASAVLRAACPDVAPGSFPVRNACRGPAIHEVDVRLTLGPFALGRAGLELTLDLLNATDQEEGIRDDRLLLVDPTRPLTVAAGKVSIPYVVNPGFGSLTARTDRGRQLRLGLRLGDLP
jgi:hypothetical protein